MKFSFCMIFIVLLTTFAGCKHVYGPEEKTKDIAALLHLNENQRQAHLTGSAKMLVNEIADTMITVSRGQVHKNSNEEIYNRFNNYFASVEYIKWDDLEEPVINISDDGTFAEMIVKKIILAKYKNEKGEWEKGATLFSWSAAHKKINNRWKIISNTSTREDLEYSTYDEYYNKGIEAFKNKRYNEYLYNLERAYYITPDNVTILYDYARALTANDNFQKAFSILTRLADIRFIGLDNFEKEEIFKKLKDESGYKNLLDKISKNKKPIHNSDTAFTITEKDLVPEGLAFDNNTGTLYISSAYKRKIISIDKNGNIKDFKNEAEDRLWSTWGMEVDETRNHLWVLSSNTTEGMITQIPDNKNDGMCRVYKYDTVTGKLLKIYNYKKENEKHFFNDLTVGKSGDVYITESLTSKIYKISKEKDEIELLYQADPMFFFLNGLALNENESKLFVTSSEGISVLDLKTLNWQLLQIPKDVCLEGIDGLTFYKETLIAQQSGHPNNSIMQYTLDPTNYKIAGAKILEANNPVFDSATTGEIGGDYYYYITNSQVRTAFTWGANGPQNIKPLNALNDIVILKVKL